MAVGHPLDDPVLRSNCMSSTWRALRADAGPVSGASAIIQLVQRRRQNWCRYPRERWSGSDDVEAWGGWIALSATRLPEALHAIEKDYVPA